MDNSTGRSHVTPSTPPVLLQVFHALSIVAHSPAHYHEAIICFSRNY
jgi:hypothetical protein